MKNENSIDSKSRKSFNELGDIERNKRVLIRELNISRHEDPGNYLHGILCILKDEKEHKISIDLLKQKMKNIFISATDQLVVTNDDIEELLKHGLKKEFITINPEGVITLTKKGFKTCEVSYNFKLRQSYYMAKFLSQKSVMIITLVSLILLSILKITIGLTMPSQGMITEGLENFTDVVKIIIIAILVMKYNTKKIANILIIGMMLFTGISILISGIIDLFANITIELSIYGFFIAILSIVINLGLAFLKGLVGRSSGNISLLIDSGDSLMNVYLSFGVIIGLIFAIFNFDFMDSIVGIIISIIILKEGLELLHELVIKEKDFDIRSFKVTADIIFDTKLTGYFLESIRRERLNQVQLVNNFLAGLELGRKYYAGFADFFYTSLDKKVAQEHIQRLINGNYIQETDLGLHLTNKGLKSYYHAKQKEFRRRANKIDSKDMNIKSAIIKLIKIILFILVIVYANDINNWLLSL